MKLPCLAANWKMHKTTSEAKQFCRDLIEVLTRDQLAHVLIAPPMTSLGVVVEALQGTPAGVAAQNCHYEEKGAFTGEVSPGMLLDIGIQWTLIGHSERRHVFREDPELVFNRLRGALRQGLKTIYCVGEQLQERQDSRTFHILEDQLSVLQDLDEVSLERLFIAYEPVWAIGTGQVATEEQVQEVHGWIKSKYPAIPILYGGSVKPDNIEGLARIESLDGALIGGAGLNVPGFSEIIKQTLAVKGI